MHGIVEHNYLLYVIINNNGEIINQIQINLRLYINLMNLWAIRGQSLNIQYLGKDKLMVYDFNEMGQRNSRSLILPLKFKELYIEAKFHIIDDDTSFKALLGHP